MKRGRDGQKKISSHLGSGVRVVARARLAAGAAIAHIDPAISPLGAAIGGIPPLGTGGSAGLPSAVTGGDGSHKHKF